MDTATQHRPTLSIEEIFSRPVSEEEYLHTSFEHDPELIDGYLKERPMPTRLHAFVQAAISHWFFSHMEDCGVMPMSELRTRIRAARYRLPDVAVTYVDPLDEKPLTEAPLIAIEIKSPDDTAADLRSRAGDFASLGAKHIWLITPAAQVAELWNSDRWVAAATLAIPGTPIHLDLEWLWSRIESAKQLSGSSSWR